MPDPALSEAIREAYATAPAGVVVLHTLEIRHPDFAAPVRVVRNFPDTVTWDVQDAGVAAILAGLDDEARDLVGLVARLEADAPQDAGALVAWTALAFDLDLPEVDTVPVPEGVLTMDNVGRELSDALDAAATSQQPIQVIYRPYLSTDIQGPQLDPPPVMTLYDVEADPLRVAGRIRLFDYGGKSFPGKLYTARRFPGIAR